jgi:membrane protease YdiL (CAAX protease family)
MWVSALLGILLLIGPIRRVLARVLPFDPANNVHAVALSYSALLLMNLLVTLALGLRHLAQLMEASATNYNPAPGIWAQDITWVLMALVGVGWLSRRGFRSSLRHLGIVLWVPLVVDFVSWLLRRDIRAALERSGFGLLQVRHLVLGIGTGLLLVPAILAIEWLTRQAGVPSDTDVERLTEQMVGPLLRSLPGIITLGVAAALGEESIFRGALQPRFGLVFTSLLFALTHSNYGISVSTLLVFIVGLVLGLVRIRANTSTSMIVHAVYNMSLGLISYLGLMQNF